jgi:hypothetical protein
MFQAVAGCGSQGKHLVGPKPLTVDDYRPRNERKDENGGDPVDCAKTPVSVHRAIVS